MKAKLVVAVWIAVIKFCNTFIQFLRNLMIFCQEVMKFGFLSDSLMASLNSFRISYTHSPNILFLF